jgi:hypothetical protein
MAKHIIISLMKESIFPAVSLLFSGHLVNDDELSKKTMVVYMEDTEEIEVGKTHLILTRRKKTQGRDTLTR